MAASSDNEVVTCCVVFAVLTVVTLLHLFIAFHPGDDTERIEDLRLLKSNRRRRPSVSSAESDGSSKDPKRRHLNSASVLQPAFSEVDSSSLPQPLPEMAEAQPEPMFVDAARTKPGATEPSRSGAKAQNIVMKGGPPRPPAAFEAAESHKPRPKKVVLPAETPSDGKPIPIFVESAEVQKRAFASNQTTFSDSDTISQCSDYLSEPSGPSEPDSEPDSKRAAALQAAAEREGRKVPMLLEAEVPKRHGGHRA